MKVLSWDVGIYNLSYCILEKDEDIKIIKWDIINLVDNESMKKNRNLIFENIPRKLQEIPELLEVDIVVIENQPSLKNPQMKSIQMILYSYFLILGKVVGNGDQGNYIDKIEFCSASNKLKIYDGPPILLNKNKNETEEVKKNTKLKYSDKKKLAIEHAKYFIEKYNIELLNFFNDHKKKDDLADSFLQGLYFIKTNCK